MTVEVHIVRGRPAKEIVLDKTLKALQAFNDAQGLDFAQIKEDMTVIGISVFFVTSQLPQLGVRLNFDLELDFATFTLASEDTARLAELREALDANIGFETAESLLAQAQQDMSPRALVRLGRGFSKQQDRRVAKLLRKALAAKLPNVRRAAALAMLDLKSSLLLSDLQTAIISETDAEAHDTMDFVRDRLSP